MCKWGLTNIYKIFATLPFRSFFTPLIPLITGRASRMFQNPLVIPDVRIGVWNPLKLERLEVFVGQIFIHQVFGRLPLHLPQFYGKCR